MFKDAGWEPSPCETKEVFESIKDWSGRYSLIFTDTSDQNEIHFYLWRQSENLGIPSLSILDSWVWYARRFTDREGEMHYPAKMGMIDEFAVGEAVNDGLPADKMAITGHPRFDRLKSEWETDRPSFENDLRKKYRLDEGVLSVLFVSEAISRFGFEGEVGYDERSILEEVCRALQAGGRALDKIRLLVKPHPDDYIDRLEDVLEGFELPWYMVDESETIPALKLADLVVGMSSIILVDAVMVGKPTLSVQLGRRCEDWLMTNNAGITQAILTEQQLRDKIDSFFEGNLSSPKLDINEKLGIDKTCRLITSMMSSTYEY